MRKTSVVPVVYTKSNQQKSGLMEKGRRTVSLPAVSMDDDTSLDVAVTSERRIHTTKHRS